MKAIRQMFQGLAALSIGLLCSAQMASAAFVLVDDFQSYVPGSSIGGQGAWGSGNAGNTVEVGPVVPSNRVLSPVTTVSTETGAHEVYAPISLPEGSTGTLFGRFYIVGADTNVAFGLSDEPNAGEPDEPGAFNSLNTVNFVFNGELQGSDVDNIVTTLTGGGNVADGVGAWYNFWVVADNGADTVQTYIQSDDDSNFTTQTLMVSSGTGGFRVPTTLGLVRVVFRSDINGGANSNNEVVLFDDIWFDAAGQNLANPIPEPGTLALGLIFGLASVVARRRQRQA